MVSLFIACFFAKAAEVDGPPVVVFFPWALSDVARLESSSDKATYALDSTEYQGISVPG